MFKQETYHLRNQQLLTALVVALLFGGLGSLITPVNATSNLRLHTDPISVTSDAELAAIASSGSGDSGFPYVIENLAISLRSGAAITIQDTTKHFIIRNNDLDGEVGTANEVGITIRGVADGTATIKDNTVDDMGLVAINIDYSNGVTIEDNTISGTWGSAIWLWSSNTMETDPVSVIIRGNIITSNGNGILIFGTDCVVEDNLFQENLGIVVSITDSGTGNVIHGNSFVEESETRSLAEDDGLTSPLNNWDGNYWSNWSGSGTYAIGGTAAAVDNNPLGSPPVPTQNPAPSKPSDFPWISAFTSFVIIGVVMKTIRSNRFK